MGGGDLNLKKSWHPSTLRNIERVWKAEQKHEVEQQKIEQLQKELAAERSREEIQNYAENQGVVRKRDERLDWMYQGPAAMVNRDDYLMGRKIDKTFDILQKQEKGEPIEDVDDMAASVFKPSTSTSNVTVDLANKIREDPLFAIMKKEKEQRKTLLSNPVRMKQLKTILKQSLKKSKKSKKKSKKSKHDTESSSSSSDSEVDVPSSHKRKHVDLNNRYAKSHHRAEEDRQRFSRPHQSYSKYEEENNRRERSKLQYNSYEHQTEYRNGNRGYNRERSNYQNGRNGHDINVKKKLSEEDKEKMRQEMMSNAKWRDEQREKNVRRYVAEGEREDKIRKGSASDFIRPMLVKAAERGTVEDRVRQKIFTIQRNKSDMDRNFARR